MWNCVSTEDRKQRIKKNKTIPFLAIAYILLGIVVVTAYFIFKSIELQEPLNSIATMAIILMGAAIINTISMKFK